MLTIIIGIFVTIILIWNEVKIRKTDLRYNFQTPPLSLFIFKLVIFIAIINLFTYMFARYQGIAYVLIVLFMLVIGYIFLMYKTIIGSLLYSFGGNVNAYMLFGVETKKIYYFIYMVHVY